MRAGAENCRLCQLLPLVIDRHMIAQLTANTPKPALIQLDCEAIYLLRSSKGEAEGLLNPLSNLVAASSAIESYYYPIIGQCFVQILYY